MNINIIYQTKTGHTEKLAKALGDVLNVEPINICEPHILNETDLLFVGTGIYGGKPDEALLDYLYNLPNNKIKGAAIFSSSASKSDNTELIVNILRQKGIEVLNKRFHCSGQFLIFKWGHPDKADIKNIKEFARMVLNFIA